MLKKITVNLLEAHAPIKTKVLCRNCKNHVDKNPRKAIMKSSALKHKASRTKQHEYIANIRNNKVK